MKKDNRYFEVTYKRVMIHGYHGNNYVYINKKIFNSMLSAKRWITKTTNHYENST